MADPTSAVSCGQAPPSVCMGLYTAQVDALSHFRQPVALQHIGWLATHTSAGSARANDVPRATAGRGGRDGSIGGPGDGGCYGFCTDAYENEFAGDECLRHLLTSLDDPHVPLECLHGLHNDFAQLCVWVFSVCKDREMRSKHFPYYILLDAVDILRRYLAVAIANAAAAAAASCPCPSGWPGGETTWPWSAYQFVTACLAAVLLASDMNESLDHEVDYQFMRRTEEFVRLTVMQRPELSIWAVDRQLLHDVTQHKVMILRALRFRLSRPHVRHWIEFLVTRTAVLYNHCLPPLSAEVWRSVYFEAERLSAEPCNLVAYTFCQAPPCSSSSCTTPLAPFPPSPPVSPSSHTTIETDDRTMASAHHPSSAPSSAAHGDINQHRSTPTYHPGDPHHLSRATSGDSCTPSPPLAPHGYDKRGGDAAAGWSLDLSVPFGMGEANVRCEGVGLGVGRGRGRGVNQMERAAFFVTLATRNVVGAYSLGHMVGANVLVVLEGVLRQIANSTY
ncbi:unnamed protein product [Vitrella brassicaformis CCMP3155]|uniref:Uncharacterized protein n=1 Tax=Vitrella brassicaformis (strain CCMP3155) TaxID=1169540 RepID=A0A0G4E9L3_VITBC|nr:unnamed protein product [Vitrella brassicaformis CCMP3155]|eukprot:CEL92103.1 unnamed protein product [Vitrella brassicaformis CCMP3155]